MGRNRRSLSCASYAFIRSPSASLIYIVLPRSRGGGQGFGGTLGKPRFSLGGTKSGCRQTALIPFAVPTTLNQRVRGSIPRAPTKFTAEIRHCQGLFIGDRPEFGSGGLAISCSTVLVCPASRGPT